MSDIDLTRADLTLEALMRDWPATIEVFLRHGMLCVGCLVNPFHTIEDACVEHGLDPEAFRAELAVIMSELPSRDRSPRGRGGLSR